MLKILVAVLIMPVGAVAASAAPAISIETACANDAQTANCAKDKGAAALMKCLHAYKKTNKSYEFSPSCKEATSKPIGNF